MSQGIRLRYTGLMLYASKGFSVLASFVYVVTVTRMLSTHDFGVAQNISDIVPYLTLFAAIIPYWAQRYTARGMKGAARTALYVNLALGISFAIICVLLSSFFAEIAGTQSIYYTLAAFQVLELYLVPVFMSTAYGKKPHVVGYVQIIHDVARVVFAIVLVVYTRMGLVGVLAAVILSSVVDIVAYAMFLREDVLEPPNLTYLRKWAKASFINFFDWAGLGIANFDMILLILLAGTVARAYYGAAYAVAVVLGYSSVLSAGLYPKLLAGGSREDVEESLKITLIFSIPMSVGILVLATSFLTVLNPSYLVATPVLYVMAVGSLFTSITSVLDSTIIGTEKVDAQREFSMRDLLRSRLFLLPTFRYINAMIDLPMIYYLLTSMRNQPETAALYCAAASQVAALAILVLKYRSAKRCFEFRLPTKLISKCVCSSLLMAFLIWILPTPTRISTVLGTVALGAVTYLAVLAALEKDVRMLAESVIEELRKSISSVAP